MQRRKFSREFKLEAVRMVRERGVTIALPLAQISGIDPHLVLGSGPIDLR